MARERPTMQLSVLSVIALAFSPLQLLVTPRVGDGPGEPSPEVARVLTSFEDNEWGWYRVLDGVMGGRSSGRFELRDGRLDFRGVLNTNGGGFASVRSRERSVSLRGLEGIRLRLRADGRRYSMRLTQGGARGGVTYQADVPTVASPGSDASEPGPWESVWVPFADFTPRWRGRQLDLPPLDPERVVGLGFTLADGVDGPFRVELDEIAAYPAFELAQLKGARSALVVIAPRAADAGAERWAAAFREFQQATPRPDVVMVEATGPRAGSAGGRALTPSEIKALRARLGCDPGAFMVRLVRQDGSVVAVEDGVMDLGPLLGPPLGPPLGTVEPGVGEDADASPR